MITRIWAEQPGTYFCISSKHFDQDGTWHDEFFTRKQFPLVQRYINELKDEGRDVYWCMHGFNKKRRLARYAEMPKLLWADLDEIDPRGLGDLRPTVAWESSPGRFACLWMLDEVLDEDTTNQKLTYLIGADKGGWDITQVLRVPGTLNHKYEDKPRVKLMWQDGDPYKLKEIKAKLPAPKKRGKGSGNELGAEAIFKKYRKHLTPWARRELLKGKARRGVRSEVFWKLTNEFLEAGANEDEAFAVLWASPWNKFKDRSGGDDQLRREIDKVYSQKMDGMFPEKEYEKESDLPHEDDETEDEEKENNPLLSMLGVAKPETPRWVLYPYLLRGHITSIEGDPEVGKSWFSLAMCAAISERAKEFPTDGWEDKNNTGSVFYFDAENDIGNVAQRMIDSDMYSGVTDPHDMAPFFHIKMQLDFREEESVDDVIAKVNQLLKFFKNKKNYNVKPALIIFDTFINFSGDTDTNKQSDVMLALSQLKLLAEELDCAVAIIRHYGKSRQSNAMHQGMGSMQFAATCRCMIGIHRHPDDQDTRVVTISKSSLASRSHLRTLTYTLHQLFPGTTDVDQRDRTRMEWGTWIDLSHFDIMEAVGKTSEKEKEAKSEGVKMQEIVAEMFRTDPRTNEDSEKAVSLDQMTDKFEREGLPVTGISMKLRKYGYELAGGSDNKYFRKKAPKDEAPVEAIKKKKKIKKRPKAA